MILLLLLLAGCGGKAAELRVAVSMIPDQIDPLYSPELDGRRIAAHLYESLLRQDETGDLQPHLAIFWEYDTTATLLTIQLRPGVLFHDGSTMTADDVAYSLERIMAASQDPDLRVGTSPYQLGYFSDVRILGELSLEIELPHPHHSLLKTLTTPFLVPIIKENSDRSPAGTLPIGTGPYRRAAYLPEEGRAILERNGQYWGAQPGPEEIIFQVYGSDAERIDAIEAGEMDVATNIAVTSVPAVIESELMNFDLTVQKAWLALSLNNQRPPFDDISTRRTLAEVLSTRSIVRTQWQSAGELMHFFVGPGLDPDIRGPSAPIMDPVRRDEEAARQFGADAEPLLFLRSPAAKQDNTERLVSTLEILFGDFGFEISQDYCEDFEEYDEKISNGDWHLSVDGFASDNGDLFSFLYEVYGKENPDGGLGLFHLEDDGLVELLEEANRVIDDNQREEHLRSVIDRIASQIPCIPLADFKSFVVRSVDIGGLNPGPYSDWTFSSVWKANWK